MFRWQFSPQVRQAVQEWCTPHIFSSPESLGGNWRYQRSIPETIVSAGFQAFVENLVVHMGGPCINKPPPVFHREQLLIYQQTSEAQLLVLPTIIKCFSYLVLVVAPCSYRPQAYQPWSTITLCDSQRVSLRTDPTSGGVFHTQKETESRSTALPV